MSLLHRKKNKKNLKNNNKKNKKSTNNIKPTKTVQGIAVPDEYQKYQQEQAKEHPQLGFLGKLMHKFHIMGTSKQLDESGENKFNHSILDMLGYKRLTPDRDHFLELATSQHATRGYAEILQIGGSSLYNLPPRAVENILNEFINFLRAFLPDMTFISLHLPSDSKPQQHSLRKLRHRVNYRLYYDNDLTEHQRKQLFARRQIINNNLQEFTKIDLSVNNQAFCMLIFAPNERKLRTYVDYAFQFGNASLKLSHMTVKQKETFLTRLNNPSNDA